VGANDQMKRPRPLSRFARSAHPLVRQGHCRSRRCLRRLPDWPNSRFHPCPGLPDFITNMFGFRFSIHTTVTFSS